MPEKKTEHTPTQQQKKKRIFESQNWKSNANPPNEYSNILVQPYFRDGFSSSR